MVRHRYSGHSPVPHVYRSFAVVSCGYSSRHWIDPRGVAGYCNPTEDLLPFSLRSEGDSCQSNRAAVSPLEKVTYQ
jgi:hypothetical protein